MITVFEAILAHQRQREGCMLVSAIGAEGSAPRKTQAHMLVDSRGIVCGSVGGGAVEANSIAFSKKLLQAGKSGVKTFELFEQASESIGMICGGKVDVHFRWISPEDERAGRIAESAVSAFQTGSDAWLIIDLDHHALSMYYGGTAIGDAVPDEVIERLNSASFTCHADGRRYYAEQLAYSDRVYIFGGGHVAQALVPMLALAGFSCVVVEDREEFCQKRLFPQAREVLLLHEKDWRHVLSVSSNDCICIMTRGHQNDLACQAYALETNASYIGVIGSRRKAASVNARLEEMGCDRAEIARIVTPIGLEIGAVTPAEIAVSITAQLIKHRAERRKGEIKKSCMA